MNESRHERFKRLATLRTNAVLEKLRLMGNLSSKTNYEYSEEEVSKIFYAIEAQLRTIKAIFSGKKKRTPHRHQRDQACLCETSRAIADSDTFPSVVNGNLCH